MDKDIIKYLHYYLGQVRVRHRYVDYEPGTWTVWEKLTIDHYGRLLNDLSIDGIQLELRKLESMAEEEIIEYAGLMTVRNISVGTPKKVFKNNSGHVQVLIGDENAGASLFPLSTFGGNPAAFHYLLSLGIDLFGLIDAGLAIDKVTIKS